MPTSTEPIEVLPVAEAGELDGDAYVADSVDGTLFHRLRFLAYHGSRFAGRERHLVFREGTERVLAVLPLAIETTGGVTEARSPFGASVGGPALARLPSY